MRSSGRQRNGWGQCGATGLSLQACRVLAEKGELEVEVGGKILLFSFIEGVRSSLDNPAIAGGDVVGSAEVRDPETGELVPFDQPFWFAVGAFRPDTRIVDG